MLARNLIVDNESEFDEASIITQSKSWTSEDWETYLSSIESKPPEEEIYVGTANDLEKYLSKNQRSKKF